MKQHFFAERAQHQEYGEIICLKSVEEGTGKVRKAEIVPDRGFNLISYYEDGESLIYTLPDILKEEGFSGTPILYPTPNRVRNAQFYYGNKKCVLEKNGEKRYLHGLVYDEKWMSGCLDHTDDMADISAFIKFSEESPYFPSFPWKHTLKVKWILNKEGIRLEYEVCNNDESILPYGFAIHPYFPVCAYGEKAKIKVPAEKMFESTKERFPTGRRIHVSGSRFDLRRYRNVEELNLDDVYTGMSNKTAEIQYGNHRLLLSASEEFNQMVVYTPDKPFFCLENQTCMTDAHNFFHEGYKESGLIQVEPHKGYSGWIEFKTVQVPEGNPR